MRNRSLAVVVGVGAGLLCAAAIGCGDSGGGGTTAAEALRDSVPEHGEDPGPQAEVTYVGRLAASDALVAVVARDGAAVAYVCDGRQLSEWFLGSSHDGDVRLEGEKGGSVAGALAPTGIAGAVTTAGAQDTFAATPAVERESGLYRSVDDESGERIVTGWIFLDGELRGADEDSGKSVVGSIALGGLNTGTGTGIGLPPPGPTPAPVPQSCADMWCDHETKRCLIHNLDESRKSVKNRRVKSQIDEMLKAARDELDALNSALTEGGCIGTSACDDGYGAVSAPLNCSGG